MLQVIFSAPNSKTKCLNISFRQCICIYIYIYILFEPSTVDNSYFFYYCSSVSKRLLHLINTLKKKIFFFCVKIHLYALNFQATGANHLSLAKERESKQNKRKENYVFIHTSLCTHEIVLKIIRRLFLYAHSHS